MEERKNYQMIDFLRMFFALFIVAGHVGLLTTAITGVSGMIDLVLGHWISRLAVPFFFTCTGFFVFRAGKEVDFKYTKVQAWKLLKAYLIWSLIYLPLGLYDVYLYEGGIVKGLLVFVQHFFFEGIVVHLWYLRSCAVAILIVGILLCKKWKPLRILILGIAFYLVGLLFQGYYYFIQPIENIPFFASVMDVLRSTVGTTRNGVFFGFVYVALGMFLARVEIKLSNVQIHSFLFVSLCLLLLESLWIYFCLKIDSEYFIMSFPTILFLFLFAIRFKCKKEKDRSMLRKTSGWIYFIHYGLYVFIRKAYELTFPFAQYTPILFFTVAIVTILLSLYAVKFSQKHPLLRQLC